MVAGLGLQAIALGWLATEASITQTYASMIGPFVLAGCRHGARVRARGQRGAVLGARSSEAGQASGATNAIRELGGVLGIAVLATVFTSHGSYASPQAYVDGLGPGDVGRASAVLGAGALIAAALPVRPQRQAAGRGPSAERRGRRSAPRSPSSPPAAPPDGHH